MKHLFIFSFLLVALLFVSCSEPMMKVVDGDYTSTFSRKNGRIHGKYISYHLNGNKKAEGTLENHLRKGKWTLYDTSGTKVLERDYSNHLNFIQTYPEPKEKRPDYPIIYNEEGYVMDFEIREEIYYWSKRIWRDITPEANDALMNEELFQTLNNAVKTKQVSAYEYSELRKLIVLDRDFDKYTLIGWKIMEDCFFDIERYVAETRLLGIAPLVIHQETKDTLVPYWTFYPQVQPIFAKTKIESSTSDKVKTVNDIFYYRDFKSQIYMEENVYERAFPAYLDPSEYAKESERIEIMLLEDEHDLWLQFLEE